MAVLSNTFYWFAGVVFLALAKLKNMGIGYKRTRAFSASAVDQAVNYDIKVVDEWLNNLAGYAGPEGAKLQGKRVLELGPGPDFGVGLYLLAKGARDYSAIDAFPLAYNAPVGIYRNLIDRVADKSVAATSESLLAALPSSDSKVASDRFRYVVRADFDVSAAFAQDRFDVVFSQAAFEHFDDPEKTIQQMSRVTEKGAVAVLGIDLQTHSRWISQKDPLNIYRYPNWIYRAFGFRGMPNRVPVSEYVRLLKKHGWEQIKLMENVKADDSYFSRVKNFLTPAYRNAETQSLWIVICATRAG